jgi:hypothetical protein
MDVTYYKCINKGTPILCRGVTLEEAQREVTADYRWSFCDTDAVIEIIGEDKTTILSTRHGEKGKWEK